MKKWISKKIVLIVLGMLLFTISIPIAFSQTTERLEFDVKAEGDGLIIWGFSWMPPYPGESFYLGGPGPDPPLVPIPLFNWGSPGQLLPEVTSQRWNVPNNLRPKGYEIFVSPSKKCAKHVNKYKKYQQICRPAM